MNKNILKNIAKLMMLAIIFSIGSASCSYDDFVENEYDYTAVYFPKTQIDRSFILGEGMQIGVGVVLGGRLVNTENVEVTFSLNDALVTDAGLSVLPSEYYQLVDENGNSVSNKITIPAGKVQGFVYVKADSASFLADSAALGNNYALGFQIDNVVMADSILANMNSTLITFSYINKLYGYYVQKGQYVKTGAESPETVAYTAWIDDVLELTMKSPNSAVVNGLATFRSDSHKMDIVIASDNTITIHSIEGAVQVTDDGGSYFDPATHEVYLNYSFEFNGSTFKANDILDFRNRVVDGVNQYVYQ